MTSARLHIPSLGAETAPEDETDPPLRRSRERARLAVAATSTVIDKEQVSLAVPRDTHYLSLVRRVISDVAARAGFSPADVDKIELAVDEACSNAMLYQEAHEEGRFDRIEIEVSIDHTRFTVVLRDGGNQYPFEEQGNFDLEDHLRRVEPGGLGIYIIKNFMDEVFYEHSAHGGNVLTMVKSLRR